MGPEDSEKKEVKVYMMVDGELVEINPEIVEITYSEDQQSNDVLDFGECEITMQVEPTPVPLAHGRMIYRCEQCGRSWAMFLEKGIEEFGENHKPSPFAIGCPYCGGWAMDVSGIQKIPGGYIPLPEGGHYFANMEGKNCGAPVFCAERLQEEDGVSELIAEALARLKSREMEMCQDAMREEQERMEEIINRTMPDEAEEIGRTSVIIAERVGVSLEEAVGIVLKAIQEFGNYMKTTLAPFLGEPDLKVFEPGEPLDVPTAWDRKEAREKRRAVERAAASRFQQYKARESSWAAQKRTGQRRREWRGPWRDKRTHQIAGEHGGHRKETARGRAHWQALSC